MFLTEPPIGYQACADFYSPVKTQLVEYPIAIDNLTFRVTSHVKAAPNIKAFFGIVQAHRLSHLIKTWDGCYNDRPKRLSNQLSMHGRGAAFDINASENEQGTQGNMPQAIVDIAHSLGFFWGGDFRGRYRDSMHFQLGVDFPLDGRPRPEVTYGTSGATIPLPVSENPLVAFEGKSVNITVKAFGPDGQFLGQILGAPGLPGDGGIIMNGHAYIRAISLPRLLGIRVTPSLEHGELILRMGK